MPNEWFLNFHTSDAQNITSFLLNELISIMTEEIKDKWLFLTRADNLFALF